MATQLHMLSALSRLEGQTRVFEQPFARVDFRVYHSGAHGPRLSFTTCLRTMYLGSTLRRCALHLGIHSYAIQRKDEEIQEDNNLLPSCGVGHKRGYAEERSDLYNYPHETRCSFVWSV